MLGAPLDDLFHEILDSRRLLTHPFYRRWEAGGLAPGELATYAEQYRYFETALPEVLEQISEGVQDDRARALVRANLEDERGHPTCHLALFNAFLDAVGGDPTVAETPATRSLVELYRDTAERDSVAALSALAAYEVQAAEVATSKAAGLREHYGLSPAATTFWDVHGTMDADHASWALDALAAEANDEDVVRAAASAAAKAWWEFLDEREESAALVTA